MDSCFKMANHDASEMRRTLFGFISASPLEAWVPYYNFNALLIPNEILYEDKLLKDLGEIRTFHAGILKTPPSHCYNWHMDTDRNAALNMLVYDDGKSRCIFAPNGMEIVVPIVELKYEPNHFYAFNTKLMHMVLNSDTPRYLLSLEFMGKDYGLTYQQLLNDLKELGYVD